MKSSVRRITDGAFMTAIIGLLIVLDGQSGILLDGLLFWLIPIPIIIYSVKYDTKSGLMVAVSISIMAFMLTIVNIALLITFSNIIGLAYAFAINRKFSDNQRLLITFLATFVYYVLSMIVFAGFFGYDAVAELKAMTEFLSEFAGKLGQDPTTIISRLMQANPFFKMMMTFPMFIPSIIALMQTIITNMVAKVILQRLKLASFEIKSILNFKLPKKTGLILIAILLITYVFNFSNITAYENVIIIVQFSIQLVFIIMGLILALTFTIYVKVPLLSILVAILMIGMPYLMFGLGIVNVFTEVRNMIVRRMINER